MVRTLRNLVIAVAACGVSAIAAVAQEHPGMRRVSAGSIAELRQWDQRLDAMQRAGDLQTIRVVEDADVRGRTHERVAQYHRGVRVFGADVTRQLAGGQTLSVFGTVYAGIDVDTTPAISAERAAAVLERLTGEALGVSKMPALTILPLDAGGYALAWRARILTGRGVTMYFVDARSGEVIRQINDTKTQVIGRGTGVFGDTKKMSVEPTSGGFRAVDRLRPPFIGTFDMKGDLQKVLDTFNGRRGLFLSDTSTDSDNDWRDSASVDAHAYSGYTYDYFFKRHGRRGLDNNNLQMVNVVHPVNRQDFFTYSDDVIGLFFLNAAYLGNGWMLYGEGAPPNVFRNVEIDYFAGGLDVVAHELTHGVTDYTSDLIYRNESGALNEAFSDIMATSIEFMFEPAGTGNQRADYLIGEDVVRPGGIRSMSNPAQFGDPDHYSNRFTGPEDNGGVHINSAIPNQAFYLAIEGGSNRTSGVAVTGVGSGNREQIEKVFYRAFTLLMPASANFATARAATIQAARDLYGGGSAAERAVTQAWTAVGVN